MSSKPYLGAKLFALGSPALDLRERYNRAQPLAVVAYRRTVGEADEALSSGAGVSFTRRVLTAVAESMLSRTKLSSGTASLTRLFIISKALVS